MNRQREPRGRRDHNGGATKQMARVLGHSKEPVDRPPARQLKAATNTLHAPTRPLNNGVPRHETPDLVKKFFDDEERALPAPTRTDPHVLALDVAVAAAKICKPLNFTGDEDKGSGGEDTLDLGPTLSLARHTPGAATSHSLQLGAVTGQVYLLQIGDSSGSGLHSQTGEPEEAVTVRQTGDDPPGGGAKWRCRSGAALNRRIAVCPRGSIAV
ncbi:hypothetical protein D1007_57119 [Hordeum vulgare]|nr:hypothetical protein D1007_57119 [Hordeum vulgare]